ncbi:Dcw1p [Sugiyamaella lignohabitans]|uniref:Mannan endo-1,6-alpha-mannosidase n=1 Tax=Sugiyamaella lignohabitans TaxID=796027 RepID=A0A167CDC5_9ASCO|nr:Dcw1p [Sugiyamaella lignohabitans]ANB11543.1 Dcw1p [Sugiyamaella lignohabitans]
MKLPTSVSLFALTLLQCVYNTVAITVDFQDDTSLNNALALVADGLMDYYNGDQYGGTPGMFVNPYYWWEAGAAFGSMLDYWFYTGNTTYNDVIKAGMLYQTGKNNDYMPSNQTTTEGNDDQGFWGILVMDAAEKNFSNPDPDQAQWLSLAQAVFNTMASRWDTDTCHGGLRWQIFTWNNGYNYKNSVANGCFFHMGARLARYTGNTTYSDWSEKVWDWMTTVGFINETSGQLIDGADISTNCTTHTPYEWTYNYGLFTAGAAYLYDFTNDTKWLTRAQLLMERGSSIYFDDGVMFEAACQNTGRCNNDQRSFKAIYSRFLGLTAQLAPPMADQIMNLLSSSAAAAAISCSGGTDGHTCGLNWNVGKWDGVWGLGEQMSALEVMQNTRALQIAKPLTAHTGGSSKGNPAAGSDSGTSNFLTNSLDISSKDRAGAGILTALLAVGIVGTGWWMMKQ